MAAGWGVAPAGSLRDILKAQGIMVLCALWDGRLYGTVNCRNYRGLLVLPAFAWLVRAGFTFLPGLAVVAAVRVVGIA